MKLKIFTDGACSGNPGKGGWAAIILDGNKQSILSGSESNTTNNRMELMAPIMALKKLKKIQKLLFTQILNMSRMGLLNGLKNGN